MAFIRPWRTSGTSQNSAIQTSAEKIEIALKIKEDLEKMKEARRIEEEARKKEEMKRVG